MLIHFQFQMESQRDTILFLVSVEEKKKRLCWRTKANNHPECGLGIE